jgi:hypothetical protein
MKNEPKEKVLYATKITSFWDRTGEYFISVYSNCTEDIKRIVLNSYSKTSKKNNEVKVNISEIFEEPNINKKFLVQHVNEIRGKYLLI